MEKRFNFPLAIIDAVDKVRKSILVLTLLLVTVSHQKNLGRMV